MTTSGEDKRLAEFLSDHLKFEMGSDNCVFVAITDMQGLLDFIGEEFSPEQVFTDTALTSWAYSNGMEQA